MAIKCHGENDDEPSHLWGYGILISNKLLESYVFSALISLITKVSLSKRPGFLITIHFKQSSQSIWMFSQYILQRLGGLLHWSSAENVHNFYIWYTVFLDFSMSICSCIYAICIWYIYICVLMYWQQQKYEDRRTCRFRNPDETTTFGRDQHGESVLNLRSGPFVGRRGTLW